MIFFSILFTTLTIVYFWLLLRLQGNWKDRLFIITLRAMVVICTALLLFSPRFETVHKEWKDPVFLVLEDDSASVRLASHSENDKELLIRELSTKGRVLFKRFSNTDSPNPYSIETNLREASKIDDLRGIFLLSDGHEISKKKLGHFSIPIFPIPRGSMKTRDYWVKLNRVPQTINLNQKITLRGSVGRSFVDVRMQSKSVKLRFSIDNLGVAERSVQFNSGEQSADFEQEIYFDKAGEILLSIDLEPSDEDAVNLNNNLKFRIQVKKKRRKVVLVSNEIGFDKAFYIRILRRDPALNVKSLYTRAKYPESRKNLCAQLENAELLVLHTLDDKFFSECINEKYSDIPRIHLVELQNKNVISRQIDNFINTKTIKKLPLKQADWNYRLDSKNFPPLKLYEHEAFEKTLLSSLPEIDVPKIDFELKSGILSPFFLETEKANFPLLLIDEGQSPVTALFTSTELHKTSFAPWARDEQKDFMINLFQRLVSWMMDYEKVRGLNVFIPKTSFLEGESFVMDLNGDSESRWKIKNMDSLQIIHSGSSPVRFKQTLPVGNYQLTINRLGREILKRDIRVDFDDREFQSLGVDSDQLRRLADLSGGKWSEHNGKVNAQTVLDRLSGNLLQKKLELKRSQVDLQKNTHLALIMMLLLSLEWVYRLLRKMV